MYSLDFALWYPVRRTNMADESSKMEVGGVRVAPQPPPPPVAPFQERRNLMKLPASLIGKDKETTLKKSALDVCKDFVCFRYHRMYQEGLSWLYHNNDVGSCLQDGPTCGLIALKLAADILRTTGSQSSQPILKESEENEIAELLQLSKDSGFSYHGEMFSARDMASLAKMYYNINYKVLSSGLEDCEGLVKHVFQGYPVVVPYDSDRNNEPCLKRGHKAHWAVITGFLLGLEHAFKHSIDTSKEVAIHHLKAENFTLPSSFESKDLFLIARHGKSRHYGLWSWFDLCNSNKNLTEFDPVELQNIEKSGAKRCLLTEGVEKGLCSKALFFYP